MKSQPSFPPSCGWLLPAASPCCCCSSASLLLRWWVGSVLLLLPSFTKMLQCCCQNNYYHFYRYPLFFVEKWFSFGVGAKFFWVTFLWRCVPPLNAAFSVHVDRICVVFRCSCFCRRKKRSQPKKSTSQLETRFGSIRAILLFLYAVCGFSFHSVMMVLTKMEYVCF